MNKSYIVTFPRSGHHILLGLLDSYVNVSDNYCEFYECKNNKNESIQCPMNNDNWTAKKSQCGSGRQLIKSHDFDLELKYSEEINYLVQLRNPILSIQSWYELQGKDLNNKDEWEVFFTDKFEFWKRFVDKWLALSDRKNVLVVNYDSLSDYSYIDNIRRFLSLPFRDENRYSSDRFNPKRKVIKDPYGFLAENEDTVSDRLRRLGIDRIFS